MKQPIPSDLLLHATKRNEWRSWLRKHYKTEKEVWLVFFKKHTGKPRISYNDAVEESLCFGWIDSTAKTIDGDRFAQRFSPRKDFRNFSQPNIERLRYLVGTGRVAKDILDSLPDLSIKGFSIADDISEAIYSNELALKHFRQLPKPYIRIRISFIEGARKRPSEFKKRLSYFISMTSMNKRIGFGGIEKHYESKPGLLPNKRFKLAEHMAYKSNARNEST